MVYSGDGAAVTLCPDNSNPTLVCSPPAHQTSKNRNVASATRWPGEKFASNSNTCTENLKETGKCTSTNTASAVETEIAIESKSACIYTGSVGSVPFLVAFLAHTLPLYLCVSRFVRACVCARSVVCVRVCCFCVFV